MVARISACRCRDDADVTIHDERITFSNRGWIKDRLFKSATSYDGRPPTLGENCFRSVEDEEIKRGGVEVFVRKGQRTPTSTGSKTQISFG